MIAQIGRFTGVGVLATLVHVTIAFAVQSLFDLAPQNANFIGFSSAVLISYFGHAKITFQVSGGHITYIPRFIMLALLGLVVSSATTHVVVSVLGLAFATAMVMVGILVPVATFFGSKFWVFVAVAPNKRSHINWGGVALSVGLALVFLAMMWGRTVNHDTGWYLYATRAWLDGAQLYVDIVEVNPPMNFYLTVPTILLADLLGLSDINAQFGLLAMVLAASLIWVWQLLVRHSLLSKNRQVFVLVGTGLALLVPAIPNIAQREHIMLILLMPYLFGHLLLAEPGSGKGAVARALVAAVGLCIKPFFMFIPLLITVVMILRSRSVAPIWSAANVTIVLVGLAYVFLARLLHPEFFETIIPTALHVYADYGFSDLVVFFHAEPLIILLFAILLLLQLLRPVVLPNGGVLAAAAIAGLAIYVVQWTGYQYQLLPLTVFISLYCVWMLANAQNWAVSILFAGVLLGLIGSNAITAGFYSTANTSRFTDLVKGVGPEPAIMIFSTSLSPAFPLVVETGATWTSRYPAMWLVPGSLNGLNSEECAKPSERCQVFAEILDQTRIDIVTDFVSGTPDLVLFNRQNNYFQQPGFDFKEFLAVDPRFLGQLALYDMVQRSPAFETWIMKPGTYNGNAPKQ
ncbi:MAG: GtrA family protein [Paracoccaceae bacterium]